MKLCVLLFGAAGLLSAGCANVADYVEPAYGSRIRQLVNPDGHEHNLYYDRNPWNADGSRMLGIRTDLQQRNWRVVLYDGDGCFLKELFSIDKYDWRVTWDRNNPDLLYTWRASRLYRYNVSTGAAELLKSFAPLSLKPNGPSLNQAGDRILAVTSDDAFRSFSLSDMGGERTFTMDFPPGCAVAWDKPRYIGYKNYIFAHCHSSDGATQAVLVYDDTGVRLHRFEGVGGGGHFDFSPNGKWAYFKMPTRGQPLEIHVVNLDGTGDRVLYSASQSAARYVQNLHLAWPAKIDDWFIASFFPSARNLPASYSPPLDEIMLLNLDGTHEYLARTGTVYSAPGGRGGLGDMFWAQPLARPSADGKRINFNSNRTGTIDEYILYPGSAGREAGRGRP